MLKKHLLVATIITLSIVSKSLEAWSAEAVFDEYNGGKGYPLCQEIRDILNGPERKTLENYPFISGSEFIIPKKYKNFTFPNWQDVDLADLEQFPKIQDRLNELKEFNKKYEGKAKILVQKAEFDFDNNGKIDKVIRYKANAKGYDTKNSISDISDQWRLFLAESDFVNTLEKFNKDSRSQNPYFIVFYGKKPFFIHQSGYGFLVHRPLIIGGIKEFGLITTCSISFKYTAEEDERNEAKKIADKIMKEVRKKEKQKAQENTKEKTSN